MSSTTSESSETTPATPEETDKQAAQERQAQLRAKERAEDAAAKEAMSPAKYQAWKTEQKKKKEKQLAKQQQKKMDAVEKKREEERIKRELAWKKKKAADAARIAYIDSLTKRYKNNGGLYFGALSNNQDKVWGVPEGDGEWTRNTGDTMYDGKWLDGKMNGTGTYYFGGAHNDGDNWKGEFMENELHGLGMYSYKFVLGTDDKIIQKEAIYFKSRRVCFCEELEHGQMIKLKTGVEPNIVWVNATVLQRHGSKPQLWQLKYQHTQGDCVKWIDLSRRQFHLLRSMPLCHRFEAADREDRVPRSVEVYAPERWKLAQKKIYNVRMGIDDDGGGERKK